MNAGPVTVVLEAVRSYLEQRELPELASVAVNRWGDASLQLAGGPRARCETIAAALVWWVELLPEPSAEVWREPSGARVLLSVQAQLAEGVRVKVYDAFRWSSCEVGASLSAGESVALTIASLRALAAAEREAGAE